jgi:hypothetical protein
VTEPLHCAHCGDVIGVYEPLIALARDRARETSVAAEAVPADSNADYYHRVCYDAYRHSQPFDESARLSA